MFPSGALTNPILRGRKKGLTQLGRLTPVTRTGTQCGQPPDGLGQGCLVLVWAVVSMFGLVEEEGRGWVSSAATTGNNVTNHTEDARDFPKGWTRT